MSNDTKVFMALKRRKDIRCDRARPISDAVRSGTASFGIDDGILRDLKRRGVAFAGIYLKETGDKFLTTVARFFDSDAAKPHTTRRGAAIERHLPISQFRFRAGRVKL